MKLAYHVLPLVAACAVSAVLVRLPATREAQPVVRWVIVLAVATVVTVLVHRSLVRMLPLAALLELSIQFPGPAPSRYAVARDAGDSRKLAETVARAQRGDRMVDLADAEAARDILALIAALRVHDANTRGHSERVRVFTDLIADQLHLSVADRGQLRWAALLHDVGKLDIPAAVLNKSGALDASDWQSIRGHPDAGARITTPLAGWLGDWADTIAQHHEKFDGTGYPLGLSGDAICLGARIVAVADAFDVMTAARSYRQPIGREAALRELRDCSGTHFDPHIVRAMLAVSAPRLRWAMGPLSWLGATPFLAASQGAATAVAQATAGVLVVGSVVVAGPSAAAAPSPVPVPVPVPAVDAGRSSSPAQTTVAARPMPTASAEPVVASGKPTGPTRTAKPTSPPGLTKNPHPGNPTHVKVHKPKKSKTLKKS